MYGSADAGEKEMKDNFARISYHQIVCSVKHTNGSICLFKLFRHCGYINRESYASQGLLGCLYTNQPTGC